MPIGAAMPREGNSPKVFAQIDENLRLAYAELLNEDLPERFVKLIQKLRESDPDLKSEETGGERRD